MVIDLSSSTEQEKPAPAFEIEDLCGEKQSFEKTEELIQFVKSEINYWEKIDATIMKNLYSSHQTIVKDLQYVITYLSDEGEFEEGKINEYWLNDIKNRWVWSGHAWISAWIDASKISHESGRGFLAGIQAKHKNRYFEQQSGHFIIGYILAFEYNLKKPFDDYMDQAKNQIKELENTYQEKLRLSKPAEYWKKKAAEHKTQGEKWAKILAGALIAGVFIFGGFFILWIANIENIKLSLDTLQGALLFATVLAIYAYLIKSVTKMVFSSFHLQRDAEEREQLTHVYLALINEKDAVREQDRKIVLQALFSRADSGLLHKDSSPAMPGSIHEFMRDK